MRSTTRNRVLTGLLMALMVASGAWAQAPTPRPTPYTYDPPRMQGRPITLDDAVRITIANDPDTLLSQQSAEFSRGVLQEESGAFDPAIVFQPSYVHSEGELIGFAFLAEENRRKTHRILADRFQRVADDLERQVAEQDFSRASLSCEQLFGAGTTLIVDGRDVCGSLDAGFDQQLFDLLILTAANLPASHPLAAQFRQIRDELLNATRAEVLNLIHVFNNVAASQREALRRLGAIPDVAVRDELTLDLRYRIPFREGFTVGPAIVFQGTRTGFRNKPHNPIFGGATTPTLFRSIIGFTVDTPLLRGFGRVSAQAPERAAEFNFGAAQAQADHRVAESVLRTVTAYWNLVGAQERLGLLERSLGTQQRILEISSALAEADELAPADLDRTRARVAESQSSVGRQRQAVIRARVALADAMGLDVADLDNTPLAAEAFPPVDPSVLPAPEQTAAVIDEALARREDVKAARQREESSKVLLEAARAELKPRLDVSFLLAYNGLAESFLDDIYEPAGYQEAFDELVGPSFTILFTWELPIGNNRQKGLLLRADALHEQSNIQATNLERVISTNIVEIVESARRTLTEIERRRASAEYYEETVSSAVEMYRGGELNLIDAILTEERLTFSLLDLVSARQTYATLISRLKFETAALVNRVGASPAQFTFDPRGIAPSR
jgi:outer membrane protein TolC